MLFAPSEEHETVRRHIRELSEKVFRPRAAHHGWVSQLESSFKIRDHVGFGLQMLGRIPRQRLFTKRHTPSKTIHPTMS